MKTFFKTTGAVAMLGAAMMFNPMTAFATDDKIHPGSMCKPTLAADAQYVSYLDAGIFHSKQTGLSVSCPIVRDNTRNTNGIHRVYVRVKSGSSSRQNNIRCGVVTRGYNGQALSYQYLNASATPYTSQTLTFSGINKSAKNGGAYQVSCTLPRATGVVYYEVEER